MQSTRSRGLIVGLAALAVLLGMWMFAGSQAYAQEAAPTEETTTEATSETQAPQEAPKQDGWQADGTYVRNGVLLQGLQDIGGKLYNFGNGTKGVLYTGNYGGKYYVSGSLANGTYNKLLYVNGKPFSGTKNNKLYKAGKVYSGVSGSYYYKSGVKQTKYKNTVKKMNDGKIYYFQKSGKVYKGTAWKRVKGKRYYFKKGTALTGWKYVGKYKYYFDSKGRLCQDLIAKFGNKWKKKDITIKVNRKKNCVTLYAKDGKRGYTIPVKAMACSVGKSKTPTVKGTYYLSKGRTYRWAKLGGPTMGGYCYGQYCSRITGGYLFHSVNFNQKNNRTLSSAAYNNLGKAASHGCIRLQTANAKIIYDIARNKKTKVVIYDGKSAGPFDKPTVKKIKSGQHYDPTDPNIKKKKK
ncbi:L,D-transpeptidase family protein [Anaerovorax odorimutans]|uniref:L,D-transpeptidase family protein n=1 Tax=Anaerovorax odorimutans TaxID=109327 RepID=A0ABT1RKH5_9FIRM|nr:L,D-transpeptidase [Anaerovorax odorimutans]MCQ4635682.1 L,D-transpeptidase family protein [Anaerovorax odorimutans]